MGLLKKEETVKDCYVVLRQKELELERVRKEIRALLIVATLLMENEPTEDVTRPELARVLDRDELDGLATFYPFVAHLKRSQT